MSGSTDQRSVKDTSAAYLTILTVSPSGVTGENPQCINLGYLTILPVSPSGVTGESPQCINLHLVLTPASLFTTQPVQAFTKISPSKRRPVVNNGPSLFDHHTSLHVCHRDFFTLSPPHKRLDHYHIKRLDCA